MAHQIDQTVGDAIAFVGETPWHGLGQQMQDGATIEEWKRAAHLDWQVKEGAVMFTRETGEPTVADEPAVETVAFPKRKALYRSDTRAPLSIVSDGFKVVQPGDVLEFFRKLTEEHGFKIETAGALRGGRRIWALARIGEQAKILDDIVSPYALLSTAYDATMATWARLCATRVVCANTIAVAENEKGRIVRVPHNAELNIEDVRLQLGLALNAWEHYKIRALKLAEREVSDPEAEAFLRELLGVADDETPRGFAKILHLFNGGQMGAAKKSTRQTLWGVVQAVAEHVDHNPFARSDDTRLDSAWFGAGHNLKIKALNKALKIVEPDDASNDQEVALAA